MSERMDGPLNRLADEAHKVAVEHGWWEGGERNFGEQIANMHSELTEAWEEWRHGQPIDRIRVDLDDVEAAKAKGPEGIPVEFADLLIRVLDTCAAYKIDLDLAWSVKMNFNRSRPYRHGGKRA